MNRFIKLLNERGFQYIFKKIIQNISKKIIISLIKILKRISGTYKKGINIFGYFKYVFGNAETARHFVILSEISGIDYSLIDVSIQMHNKIVGNDVYWNKKKLSLFPYYYRNILFINGNVLPSYYFDHKEYFKNKYNIAVWWWEFETGMESYITAFQYIDEVIVYSDFVKNIIEKYSRKKCKISKLKYPFNDNWKIIKTPLEIRQEFNINSNDYVFLFNFDYYSSFNRKNPEAVLKAFASVFSNKLDVKLILKTINGEKFPEKVKHLRKMINELKIEKQLLIINQVFTKNELISLFNSADCYISLHRGEGLGLGILESMALGKPVIATAYGGNLEFMKKDCSFLVDYKMIKANDDYPVYKDVKYWAEPNYKQAAEMMNNLYKDKNLGKIIGTSAQNFIRSYYKHESILEEMKSFFNNTIN
ncbi:MAG: glycosyltransferase family 4 protein [Spirochaetes bacterium]|nr:glycosyltransferase family 4 protein [Spirochaetota bacterium]